MKIFGWIIYRKQDAIKNESFIHWFIEEAKEQEMTLQLIIREKLKLSIQGNKYTAVYQGQPIELPDIAIIRAVEPQLNFLLEQMGSHVYNDSETSRICNHKGLTHMHVQHLDVPMTDTIFSHTDYLQNLPPMRFPFIVKEVAGRGGKQVHLINSRIAWQELLTKLPHGDLIIQNCDNVQPGKDIRVFVVGSEIIGAVLRKSNTDIRANYTLGGSAEWYQLNKQERELVQKIICSFHFGMVGIDFLLAKDGSLLFNEIEDVVGSRTLSQVSDINIVKKYITWIIKAQMSA